MTIEKARDAILGLWELVAYKDRASEADAWTLGYGETPTGVVIYHPSGRLCVQVFPQTDQPAAYDYVGYIGTYVVREARADNGGISGGVEHHKTSSSPPQPLAEPPDPPLHLTRHQPTP